MIITSGADWPTNEEGDHHRYFSCGLDAADAIKLMGQEKWDALPLGKQLDFLEKRADLLVIAYMRKEGVVSEEFFNMRVEQIKAR